MMLGRQFLKNKVRKFVYGPKATSESYIEYLRNKGMSIGEDVRIYAPQKTRIDEQYPWMITIGDHVKITQGVIILTHDYAWSVLKSGKGGPVFGASGSVKIGNNVFIGMNAIICRGVTIGNNVVIGAGSVVTKDCEENSIYAGNPAQKISDIDSFFEKRKAAQKQEAIELARAYYNRYGKRPTEEVFHEYFMLFEDSVSARSKKWCIDKMKLNGNQDESLHYLEMNPPIFASYKDFMRACFDDNTGE